METVPAEHPLKETALQFPPQPGVYMMKNRLGKIMYIGKAKNLRKRVASYFTGKKPVKTRFLVEKVDSVEHIVTKNEYEALLLENNLIKQWSPHYNINLKDGKTYPMIRITNEDFPRVFRTRRIVDDGSLYYGPYTDLPSIDLYLELISKLFHIRKCRGRLKPRQNPCLYYHIHRCSAPCCGKISREEYAVIVEEVKKLLSGKTADFKTDLEERMTMAAEALDFESAAVYRDSLQAVETATQKQEVVDMIETDRDYIAMAAKDTVCTFGVFQMRGGRLTGQELFRTSIYESEDEAFTHFLLQYYTPDMTPPKEIYLSHETEREEIEHYFRRELGVRAAIKVPVRGRHRSLMNMAEENVRIDVLRRIENMEGSPALQELKEVLNLPQIPRRIEGFDIAQLAGTSPVASMVSFFDGKPDKSGYRKYHIRSLGGNIDDFKAIREVAARRYSRVMNESLEPPDLVVIDGGKGQVNSAVSVLRSLGLPDVPVVGLAKRIEEIVPEKGSPFTLPDTSPALRLLQFIRDEAHRFATTFQKEMRKKNVSSPVLTALPGIGEKRAHKLMTSFRSISEIADAGPAEVVRRTGLPEPLAGEVVEYSRKLLSEKGNNRPPLGPGTVELTEKDVLPSRESHSSADDGNGLTRPDKSGF
jgi:excinuclease ABC subunit C